MDRIYVEELKVKNVGCLIDVDVKLTPLHAFIGPNDSGKSTLLRAVQAAMDLAVWDGDQNVVSNPWLAHAPCEYELIASDGKSSLMVKRNGTKQQVLWNDRGKTTLEVDSRARNINNTDDGSFHAWIRKRSRVIRWDPDSLRTPSSLIPEGQRITFSSERGIGLAAIYDAILSRGDDSFREIREETKKLFPVVKNIQFYNPSSSAKSLKVELVNDQKVNPDKLSEGLLYYLAFAALRYLEPTAVLLVEEPENGLHPARIKDVMGILREVSKSMQVLIATHNPLVVNELTGEEVTVVTRDPIKGTRTRLIGDTPNFKERSKVYALGELWVSYANGEDEAPLFKEPDKP